MTGDPRPPLRGPARAAFLAVLAVLLATTDERSFGTISDGQEMLSAAVSLARFGELGVSRELPTARPRDGGDAVSRYGLGLSLVEVPAAVAARLLGAARPGASTAPLFVLLQILLLAVAGGALADAARRLGASAEAAALAGVALVLATPLWAYAGCDFSEPLQAAALSLLLAGTVAIRTGAGTPGAERLAGAAAGAAVLTKPLLLAVVAPILFLALLRRDARGGRAFRPRVLLAFSVPAAVWLVGELWRFGRPFGGYPESFSTPLATGLLRLTFLPNKGILFYAPLVLFAPLGFATLRRRDAAAAWAIVASSGSIFLASATWWAWDGEAGWGPRLLVPALPGLVLLAAAAFDGARGVTRLFSRLLVALGIAVNLLGALVPFPGVYALASLVPEGGGLPGPLHLALTPSWSPVRIHARLLRERARGGDVAVRLAAGALADLDPPFVPDFPAEPADQPAVLEWSSNPLVEPRDILDSAASPLAWPFWGRSWISPLPGAADPYRLALRDQAIRALDTGRLERARLLAREIVAMPGDVSPKEAALAAEAALRLHREGEADRLLADARSPCHLWLLFVRAERGIEPACFPEGERAGFVASVSKARAEGVPVTAWARALRRR